MGTTTKSARDAKTEATEGLSVEELRSLEVVVEPLLDQLSRPATVQMMAQANRSDRFADWSSDRVIEAPLTRALPEALFVRLAKGEDAERRWSATLRWIGLRLHARCEQAMAARVATTTAKATAPEPSRPAAPPKPAATTAATVAPATTRAHLSGREAAAICKALLALGVDVTAERYGLSMGEWQRALEELARVARVNGAAEAAPQKGARPSDGEQ